MSLKRKYYNSKIMQNNSVNDYNNIKKLNFLSIFNGLKII